MRMILSSRGLVAGTYMNEWVGWICCAYLCAFIHASIDQSINSSTPPPPPKNHPPTHPPTPTQRTSLLHLPRRLLPGALRPAARKKRGGGGHAGLGLGLDRHQPPRVPGNVSSSHPPTYTVQ